MDEFLEKRLQFVISIFFLSIINFVFRFIFDYIFSEISKNLSDMSKILITYGFYAAITISAGIIAFFLTFHFFPNKSNTESSSTNSLTIERKISPKISVLFKGFNFQNFRSQIKTVLIFVCCLYIPLDALSYIIPDLFGLDVLEYEANTLLSSKLGKYLVYDFGLMIIATIIIHFFVALREEFTYRAYYLTMGENRLNESSIFIYSAVLFSLAHLSYIISAISNSDSLFYPFWWAFMALIIGIVSAYYYIKKRKLWPLIFSHWINNIISAIVLRQNIDGLDFWLESLLKIYTPFMVLGIILFIVYRKSIINHIKSIFDLLKNYFFETMNPSYFGIDLALIIILWMVSII